MLTAAPDNDVRVTFTSRDTDKADSPAAHTFTTGNWNRPHTVTLSVDDEPANPVDTDDDSVTIDIETSVQGQESDPFHGLTESVTVKIEDDTRPASRLTRKR